jgi:hypothetical protein
MLVVFIDNERVQDAFREREKSKSQSGDKSGIYVRCRATFNACTRTICTGRPGTSIGGNVSVEYMFVL